MILDQIVADNQLELEVRKRSFPLAELQRVALEQPTPLDFASALCGERVQLIAEVKKASPSKGIIRPDFNPVEIARTYAGNGAAAISVLTEAKYFQGSLDHLRDIREALGARRLPLLRKDFISDPYQVYQSRAYGADSLLLIVAILTPEKLGELLGLSHQLGLGCLLLTERRLGKQRRAKGCQHRQGDNDCDDFGHLVFSLHLVATAVLRRPDGRNPPPVSVILSSSTLPGSGHQRRMRIAVAQRHTLAWVPARRPFRKATAPAGTLFRFRASLRR